MRTAAPPLLSVLRSQLQGELLALLFTDPQREWTIRDLSDRTAGAYPTVTAEVRRLDDGDLICSRAVGRTKLISVNAQSPYAGPLAELVLMAFGPPHVLADEFADIDHIDEMWIYGSWAARSAGTPGAAPHDIDVLVLVLGHPDADACNQAARRCEQRLGREVNLTIRQQNDWRRARDGFARQVKSSPMTAVEGPWSP